MHRLIRVLPRLAGPVTATMPWGTLFAGCLAGTAYVAVMAHFALAARSPLGLATVRFAFVPVIAALAFVPRLALRPLSQTTPVPAWVTPVAHLVLAAPVLVLTCWAQLALVAHTFGPAGAGRAPAAGSLIAQLTGWCMMTAAMAACVDRTRYADLGGAVAVPVSLAAIAVCGYFPVTARFLAAPPATTRAMTIAWTVVTAAALVLAAAAWRDQWHRLRLPRRASPRDNRRRWNPRRTTQSRGTSASPTR